MKIIVHVSLGMIEGLEFPINTEEEGEITLHQILMLFRSNIFYNCTIFFAINKYSSTGDIIALCHSGYKEEAYKIIANLVMLCKG